MSKSKLGVWDKSYQSKKSTKRRMYADPYTASLAAEWLCHNSISVIEDWGCGYGGFADYISNNIKYVGVDGSQSKFADKIEDLVHYKTSVDAIHLRHVLEHNEEWQKIFENFLDSFKKRAVLTLFTPFANEAKIIKEVQNWNNTGYTMVNISLSFDEIIKIINKHNDISVKYELDIETDSGYNVEHIFYFEKHNA